MTPADLTADLAAFAAKVQQEAAALTDRIRRSAPDGTVPNEYVGYLNLAAGMIADTAAQVARDGLHLATEPTDLDTADPDVDALLAQFATA